MAPQSMSVPARGRKVRSRTTALAGVAVLLAALGYTTAAVEPQFGEWSAAVNLDPSPDPARGVNTGGNDGCPIESPDGEMLFLASNRLGSLGLNDIWVALRSSDGRSWEEPHHIERINSEFNDICPSPLPGNRLLFVSTRNANCGGVPNADIYYTRQHPAHDWLEPEPLGCEVNSAFDEFSPSVVEADGLTLLFFSSSRGNGVNHKIYMSRMRPNGRWGPAAPVEELNDPRPGISDARPNVRRDGLEIVFDSTRDGPLPQIYSSTRARISDPWTTPQVLPVTVNDPTAQQTRPSLSGDGTRLYFGSNRLGSEGSFDIYGSTRPALNKGKKK